MSTLAQFRTTIREEGNFPTDDTRLTDAVIDRAINRALKRIALVHDWPWLKDKDTFLLVPDVSGYPTPPDFLRSLSLVVVESGRQVTLRTPQEVDLFLANGGSPVYCVENDELTVAPTVNTETALLHRYVRIEKVLLNDTDTPRIPTYWDSGVIEAALATLHRTVKQVEEAAVAEANFQVWISETRDNVRQSMGAPRIYVRPGGFI